MTKNKNQSDIDKLIKNMSRNIARNVALHNGIDKDWEEVSASADNSFHIVTKDEADGRSYADIAKEDSPKYKERGQGWVEIVTNNPSKQKQM